jgi:tripartite-type tricarboxylate transporter receptor subunit TctC
VPFPPGGSTDIATRPVADRVGQALGTSSVVENRAGAGGNIGTEAVAKSAPDGYTVLVTADAISSAPHLYKVTWDPFRDFVPVIQLARQPVVLAVHPSLGVNTVAELVALAKREPGLGYATSGAGSQQHMAAEWFAAIAGIKLTHVPYKGTGEVLPALAGGQVDIAWTAIGTAVPLIKSGKLKALGVASTKRSPLLPDVPTFAEAGIPFEARSWFAIAAPAGTPRPVVDRIAADVKRIVESPEYREKYIAGLGLEPFPLGPDQFAAFLVEDRAKYAQRVKNANVRLD